MRAAAALLAMMLPAMAWAQADDRDYLTAFLEDNLSAAGRKVTVTGFEGALSSRATIEKLEIADETGIWITLDSVVLDWSRSSLLAGEIVVNELSAETITVVRLPSAAPDTSLPEPEAAGFSLPELPVSIEIGAVTADRIVLGETILGEPVEGRFDASLSLSGGAGQADLVLERTDGPESRIALEASYSNETGVLALDLSAVEAEDGIAARILDLPGAPSVDLSISGGGPLSDFSAEVQLASDGEERLAGPVTVTLSEDGAHRFSARLAGDLAPLFLPDYAAFLGDRLALDMRGTRWPTGRVVLDTVTLDSRALSLAGSASVAGDGLPEAFDLKVKLGSQDGQPILLPLPGEVATRLRFADLTLGFNAARDSGWTAKGTMVGLERPDVSMGRLTLDGSGRIGRRDGIRSLGATLTFAIEGLAQSDAALQDALGSAVSGKAVLYWQDGQDALSLPRLSLQGDGYLAEAGLRIEGLSTGLRTSGEVTLSAEDFSRFSGLAGRPLSGEGEVRVNGWASRLSGEFDATLQATTRGLALGIPQADRLLSGEAKLTASAVRDRTGTTLRAADLVAKGLAVTGSGKISSYGSDLSGHLTLASLKDLDPAWGGSVTADARFTGTVAKGRIDLSGTGQGLSLGQPEVDRLIGGATALTVALDLSGGVATLAEARLEGPNLTADMRGRTGSDELQVTGRIRDLAVLAPEFPGPVTLNGRITPGSAGSTVDLRVLGPAGVDAVVKGRLAAGQADLTLRGNANAAVVNAVADPLTLSGALGIDLALRGPLAPSSLSGRITLSGGRIAYPFRGVSLDRAEVVATLSGGQAQVAATAEVPAGGRVRVNGSVGLAAPFGADLSLTLDQLRLRDPELFETTADGQLQLSGPLLGRALLSGRIALGETNLLVPSTGFATAGDLEAITHVNDGADVRATRARAGLGGSNGRAGAAEGSGSGGGPDWLLDVTVDAPNRIFLRGRGLDAELGGSVHLGGSLRAVVPDGGIELIRGRLDLLGRRLDLTEARLVLEGDLVPYLTVIAANETDGVTSMISIEGPANNPVVTFSSVPELPQEEVLAWLLFGRGLDTISALQAVQLANAVAVLAGRGGEGVIAKLRKGFGFDDLDISTAKDGTASLSAGKYITDKIYTEIEVDQTGKSQINLNIDVRKGVTVKGKVGSDGQSGIGVFLEGDY